MEFNDISLSEILTRKVILFAQIENLPILKIQAQLQLADILIPAAKFTEAMKIALQARTVAEKLNAGKELAGYYVVAGKIELSTGDYNQSLEDLYIALDKFEDIKDSNGRGRVLNTLGEVYYIKKDLKKARECYIQALSTSVTHKDTILISAIENNIGCISSAMKDYSTALKNISYAFILNEKLGFTIKAGINLLNLAGIYGEMGKFDESMENFQKAMTIFKQFNDYRNLANCLLEMGHYYKEKGDKTNYLLLTQQAYGIANHYRFKGVELDAVTKLQNIFQECNMTDSAYKYTLIKEGIKDSIEKEKSTTHLSIPELQYQYETKKREQKISELRRDFITIAIGLILISILIISFLMISRQRQKNKVIVLEKKNLTDELEFKNKELTLNVMNLLKRNEFIIDTSRRLIDIKPEQQPEHMKEELNRIAKSLQDETTKDIWEEFELRFKQVHSGFYDRLLERFPELTPNELKMCGLLRLNLTTKEISELTGQRRETIEMARFRLRKHLGIIDSQTNLVNFLSKI